MTRRLMATLSTNVIERRALIPKFEHSWPHNVFQTIFYLDTTANKWKRVGHELFIGYTYRYYNDHNKEKFFTAKKSSVGPAILRIEFLSELEELALKQIPIELND